MAASAPATVRLTLALVLCATSAAPASAARLQQVSTDSALEALVDSIAAHHIDAGELAGITVGVTRGDETVLVKSYGHADLEWRVPMPVDAVHEIGSVTKQFTSVALLKLWEEGRLDLDADITTYLPDYDTQGRTITVRRLFDHTSGIKGYTEMAEFGSVATRSLPRDSLVALFEAVPLEFEPGTAMIYNNSAYFLLGLILEEISGEEYGDFVEEELFAPIGMARSSYCDNNAVIEGRAHGYQGGAEGLARADYIDHTWPYAAGSLCSTVPDMLTWNRALHGGEVLGEAAYELLVTPRPLADGTPMDYAMGVNHHRIPSGRVIEHGGGIPGFVSHSRWYPEHEVAVVVLQNSTTPPGPEAVADAIGEHLFGTEELHTARAYGGDLSVFAGRYRGPARGQSLTLVAEVDGDSLRVRAGGGEAEAARYLEGTTFFRNRTLLTFDIEDGVAVRAKVRQGGGIYVLERIDEAAEEAAAVAVDVLRRYEGTYEIAEGFDLRVWVEGERLLTQATNQGVVPVVAESETRFRPEMIDATIEFIVEGDEAVALILRQGGQEVRAPRVERHPDLP